MNELISAEDVSKLTGISTAVIYRLLKDDLLDIKTYRRMPRATLKFDKQSVLDYIKRNEIPDPSDQLTVDQAARMYSMSAQSLRKLIRQGDTCIHAVQIVQGSTIIISKKSMDEFWETMAISNFFAKKIADAQLKPKVLDALKSAHDNQFLIDLAKRREERERILKENN